MAFTEAQNKTIDHIWKRLGDAGIPETQRVGIIANLYQESRVDPKITNSIGAFGIQQWLGSRKTQLYDYAKERGHSTPTLDDQIDFLLQEHQEGRGWNFLKQGQGRYAQGFGYQPSRHDFNNAQDIYDATWMWEQGFGRARDFEAANDRRAQFAIDIANRFGVSTERRGDLTNAVGREKIEKVIAGEPIGVTAVNTEEEGEIVLGDEPSFDPDLIAGMDLSGFYKKWQDMGIPREYAELMLKDVYDQAAKGKNLAESGAVSQQAKNERPSAEFVDAVLKNCFYEAPEIT